MRTVRDILNHKGRTTHTIQPGASVYEALQSLSVHNLGALVVVEDGQVIGVLSERDYARKVVLLGSTSRETPVREIMSGECSTVSETDTIEQCMSLMTRRKIRHLPVLDGARLVGVVSIGDLVKAQIAEQGEIIDQLQHYIQGEF